MENKVALLDCDNVLCNMDVIHDLVKQKFGECEEENAHRFEQYMSKERAAYARRLLASHGKWSFEKGVPRYIPGIASKMQPMDGAKEGVKKLRELGYRVVILTSPTISNITWETDRRTWLTYHFEINHQDVIFARDKYLVRGDVFIDDKIKKVLDWAAVNPSGQGFVYDHLFTRGTNPELPRFTWQRFLDGQVDL